MYYRSVRNDGDIGNRWIRFNEIAGCKTKERERETKKRDEDKYFKKEGKRERERKEGKGEIRSSRKCAEPYESSKGQILRGELH